MAARYKSNCPQQPQQPDMQAQQNLTALMYQEELARTKRVAEGYNRAHEDYLDALRREAPHDWGFPNPYDEGTPEHEGYAERVADQDHAYDPHDPSDLGDMEWVDIEED